MHINQYQGSEQVHMHCMHVRVASLCLVALALRRLMHLGAGAWPPQPEALLLGREDHPTISFGLVHFPRRPSPSFGRCESSSPQVGAALPASHMTLGPPSCGLKLAPTLLYSRCLVLVRPAASEKAFSDRSAPCPLRRILLLTFMPPHIPAIPLIHVGACSLRGCLSRSRRSIFAPCIGTRRPSLRASNAIARRCSRHACMHATAHV